MFAEPEALDLTLVGELLRDRWGIDAATLEHQPVGFGSYHYLATTPAGDRWFVNVDDLERKGWFASGAEESYDWLARAFAAPSALAAAGLGFVVAARPAVDGRVLVRIDARYAMSVVAFIEGTSPEFGAYEEDDDRREVLTLLGRLHATSGSVVSGLDLARSDLSVPMREGFFAAIDDLDVPWDGGPFSERCRELLIDRRDGVAALFDRYDDLASRVRRDGWVVTHGEPHRANTLRATDGRLYLIDWDTCMVAPRERDLWHVGPCSDDGWDAYIAAGGTADLDQCALDLFELWWTLAEITGYTLDLRDPHVDDANSRAMLRWFEGYLPPA